MPYHRFCEGTDQEYGSFEVFEMDACSACDWSKVSLAAGEGPANYESGYYWHACFPGCMPDGDPSGPFATEELAIADANNA